MQAFRVVLQDPAVVRVLLSTTLSGLAMSLTWLFLNFHLEQLAFPRAWIGYANALPALISVGLGPGIAHLLPRLGYGRSLRWAMGFSALGLLGLVWVHRPIAVFGLLFLYGLGQTVIFSGVPPLLAHLTTASRQVDVFSLQNALGSGAGALGNVLGSLVYRATHRTTDVMALAGVLYLLAWAPLWGLRRVQGEPRRFRMHSPGRWGRLLLPLVLISVGAGLIMPFLNLYLSDRFGLRYDQVGGIFALSALATMTAMLLQPALARRMGKLQALTLVQALSLPLILVMAYVPVLPLVIGALLVRGALMNAGNPLYTAVAVDVLNAEEWAGFMLAQTALWSLGWAIGSAVSGQVQARMGLAAYDVLFAGMLGLYTLATLSYMRVIGPLLRKGASS